MESLQDCCSLHVWLLLFSRATSALCSNLPEFSQVDSALLQFSALNWLSWTRLVRVPGQESTVLLGPLRPPLVSTLIMWPRAPSFIHSIIVVRNNPCGVFIYLWSFIFAHALSHSLMPYSALLQAWHRCFLISGFLISTCSISFLVACTWLYKPLCQLVCWSVGPSVTEDLDLAAYVNWPF